MGKCSLRKVIENPLSDIKELKSKTACNKNSKIK